MAIATSSKPLWPFLMSKYCAVENQSSAMFRPGDRFQRIASRSASLVGQRPQQQRVATLKIAVLAPMPIASDSTAATGVAGLTRKRAQGEANVLNQRVHGGLARRWAL